MLHNGIRKPVKIKQMRKNLKSLALPMVIWILSIILLTVNIVPEQTILFYITIGVLLILTLYIAYKIVDKWGIEDDERHPL